MSVAIGARVKIVKRPNAGYFESLLEGHTGRVVDPHPAAVPSHPNAVELDGPDPLDELTGGIQGNPHLPDDALEILPDEEDAS